MHPRTLLLATLMGLATMTASASDAGLVPTLPAEAGADGCPCPPVCDAFNDARDFVHFGCNHFHADGSGNAHPFCDVYLSALGTASAHTTSHLLDRCWHPV